MSDRIPMSEDDPDERVEPAQPVELGYDALTAAILDLDRAAANAATENLLVVLAETGPDARDMAVELALDLIDGWMNADEIAGGPSEEIADGLRTLIVEVLVRLGTAYPDPVFAGAYEQSGRALLASDPVAAAVQLRTASELATTEAERAGCLVALALALGASGDLEEGLALALRARDGAEDQETRDSADEVVLLLLSDLGRHDGVQHALSLLTERGTELPDDLGEAILWTILQEATRLEAIDEPVGTDLCGALRLCMQKPQWIPDPLTRSDFATLVAWLDFLRDDLTQLELTMAAAAGPFASPDAAAQAALLRVMVAFTHSDVLAMEELLRAAASVVAASGNPGIVTAYRSMVAMMELARSGKSLANPMAEMTALQHSQGRTVSAELALFQDSIEAIRRVKLHEASEVPADLRDRLDTWCSQPDHPGADLMSVAMIWAVSASAAIFAGDLKSAEVRVAQLRACRAIFGADAPQSLWIDLFLDGMEPGLKGRGFAADEASAQRAASERYRRAGHEYAAFVADVQLAMIQVERDPPEALAAAVRALRFRQKHLATLGGSTERIGLREYEQDLVGCALRAAARIGDDRLVAELLEFLRAQEMPLVPTEVDARLPFALLLPPAAFGDDSASWPDDGLADAVTLHQARPVRMPWGRVALSTIGESDEGRAPVTLVVPLPE